MIVYLISFFLFYVLSIPIHEAGHLVMGLLTGYKFNSFRLLSYVWIKENGKIRFIRSKNSLVVGQCLLSPPGEEKNFKLFWYNFGGGFFNLLTAALIGVIAVLFPGHQTLNNVVFGGVWANITMGLMNLIPMNLGIPNDGLNIVKGLATKQARHGFYMMLYVNDEMTKGRRYRDFDASEFQTDMDIKSKNFFEVYPIMCEAGRLYDLGDYDGCNRTYAKLDLQKLSTYYRNSVMLDQLYDAIIHHPDDERAKELYKDAKLKKFLKQTHPVVFRVLAAYEYFVNEDQTKGRSLLEKAKESTNAFPNEGFRRMETDYLSMLESGMCTKEVY